MNFKLLTPPSAAATDPLAPLINRLLDKLNLSNAPDEIKASIGADIRKAYDGKSLTPLRTLLDQPPTVIIDSLLFKKGIIIEARRETLPEHVGTLRAESNDTLRTSFRQQFAAQAPHLSPEEVIHRHQQQIDHMIDTLTERLLQNINNGTVDLGGMAINLLGDPIQVEPAPPPPPLTPTENRLVEGAFRGYFTQKRSEYSSMDIFKLVFASNRQLSTQRVAEKIDDLWNTERAKCCHFLMLRENFKHVFPRLSPGQDAQVRQAALIDMQKIVSEVTQIEFMTEEDGTKFLPCAWKKAFKEYAQPKALKLFQSQLDKLHDLSKNALRHLRTEKKLLDDEIQLLTTGAGIPLSDLQARGAKIREAVVRTDGSMTQLNALLGQVNEWEATLATIKELAGDLSSSPATQHQLETLTATIENIRGALSAVTQTQSDVAPKIKDALLVQLQYVARSEVGDLRWPSILFRPRHYDYPAVTSLVEDVLPGEENAEFRDDILAQFEDMVDDEYNIRQDAIKAIAQWAVGGMLAMGYTQTVWLLGGEHSAKSDPISQELQRGTQALLQNGSQETPILGTAVPVRPEQLEHSPVDSGHKAAFDVTADKSSPIVPPGETFDHDLISRYVSDYLTGEDAHVYYENGVACVDVKIKGAPHKKMTLYGLSKVHAGKEGLILYASKIIEKECSGKIIQIMAALGDTQLEYTAGKARSIVSDEALVAIFHEDKDSVETLKLLWWEDDATHEILFSEPTWYTLTFDHSYNAFLSTKRGQQRMTYTLHEGSSRHSRQILRWGRGNTFDLPRDSKELKHNMLDIIKARPDNF